MLIKELYNALNHPLDLKKVLILIRQGVDPTIYLKEDYLHVLSLFDENEER